MKIVDLNLATLDRLASLMRPEHYVGFLLGLAGLALFEEPESDWETVRKLMDTRNEFITRQRDADEPTGLPVAPVYWTDINPEPHDDEEEVIGLSQHGRVHMLNSGAKPHVRWFVKIGDDEGEDVIEFFDSHEDAEKYLFDTNEEVRRELSQRATEAVRRGLDDSKHGDDPGHVTVEGERIKIGGGDEPASGLLAEVRAEYIADVKKALVNRKPLTAASRASRYGLTFSWDPEDAFTAIIDEERFNCFTLNVCDPARRREVGEFHPGLAVERVEPAELPGEPAIIVSATPVLSRGAAIESVKAHLRVGQNQDARMLCEARGIPITIQESQGIAYVDGYPLTIPRVVPRHFQGDEPPAEFKGPEKIGRESTRPSPEPAVIVSVDIPGVTSREEAIRRNRLRR